MVRRDQREALIKDGIGWGIAANLVAVAISAHDASGLS
jgi:hypothetical protein